MTTGVFTINPPPSRMDPGGRLYSLQNLKYFFARFAREVIFFTKPQKFLPRFAREVIFFTKSSIFSRVSRGDVIFFTKSAAKINRFLNVFWTVSALITATNPQKNSRASRAGFWGSKKFPALRAGRLYSLQNPLEKSRASRGMLYFLQNPPKISPARSAGGTIFYKNLKK